MARRFAITSRRVVVAGRLRPAAIVVEDDLINAIVDPEEVPDKIRVDDYGDAVIMAGLVDPHVHINEPGRSDWEGFETATRAAAAGGITTVVDMPLNSSPVTTDIEALDEKRRAARGKLSVDTGFYAGLVPGSESNIAELVDAGVLGAKAFLCHSGIDEFPNATERELRTAMPILAERNKPLLVHAELVDDVDAADDAAPSSYQAYLKSRPDRWELNAIELLIDLCRQTGCPVHIVHLATAEAVPMLRAAREEGLPITVETAPHYLYFAAEEIPDGQPLFKCAPPIRSTDNRKRLHRALNEGVIDLVATDHSPSPPELKELDTGDLQSAWGGISSLQLLLPALWTATKDRGATPADIARWTSAAPAKLLGIDDRIGTITPGHRANLAVWSPEAEFSVDATELHHRHKITPYHRENLHGRVEATYLGGHKIFDGTAVATDCRGTAI